MNSQLAIYIALLSTTEIIGSTHRGKNFIFKRVCIFMNIFNNLNYKLGRFVLIWHKVIV